MRLGTLRNLLPAALLCAPASAQTFQRHADIRGDGSTTAGKCLIEVEVDGTAQVEMRGSHAVLRTKQGQPALWRRFECTGQMPFTPASIDFTSVFSRGNQRLVHKPDQGGTVLVEIDDPAEGAGIYRFEIIWKGEG